MMAMMKVLDGRNRDDDAYQGNRLQGRWLSFGRGWEDGLKNPAPEGLSFNTDDGLTWRTTGRTCGYLFGDLPEEKRRELFDQLVTQFESKATEKSVDQFSDQ